MYDKAIKELKLFHNNNNHCTEQSPKALTEIKTIKNKINAANAKNESENFDKIQQIDPTQYDKKLSAYLEHLKKYPKGQHNQKIQDMIVSIKNPYYQFILKMINQYKQPDKENWNECIRLSQLFADAYTNDERCDELRRNIKEYEENILIKKKFEKKQAVIGATDYHTAKKKYGRWLNQDFRHYAKTLIEQKRKLSQIYAGV